MYILITWEDNLKECQMKRNAENMIDTILLCSKLFHVHTVVAHMYNHLYCSSKLKVCVLFKHKKETTCYTTCTCTPTLIQYHTWCSSDRGGRWDYGGQCWRHQTGRGGGGREIGNYRNKQHTPKIITMTSSYMYKYMYITS